MLKFSDRCQQRRWTWMKALRWSPVGKSQSHSERTSRLSVITIQNKDNLDEVGRRRWKRDAGKGMLSRDPSIGKHAQVLVEDLRRCLVTKSISISISCLCFSTQSRTVFDEKIYYIHSVQILTRTGREWSALERLELVVSNPDMSLWPSMCICGYINDEKDQEFAKSTFEQGIRDQRESIQKVCMNRYWKQI